MKLGKVEDFTLETLSDCMDHWNINFKTIQEDLCLTKNFLYYWNWSIKKGEAKLKPPIRAMFWMYFKRLKGQGGWKKSKK